MNVSSAKERGLVNESWRTSAVVQPHVFLARKAEAHSGEVTLWRAVAAILRGRQGTQAEWERGFPGSSRDSSENLDCHRCPFILGNFCIYISRLKIKSGRIKIINDIR